MTQTNQIMGLLEAGLKAEGLRQKLISNNVANMETPGYRRLDVKFEELLEKNLNSKRNVDLNDVSPQTYRPESTPVAPNGNDVSWEHEVGKMVKNSLRHKTFVRILNKKYQQMDMAIKI